MQKKVYNKPKKWSERSLALAAKDELVADMLIRKELIENMKTSVRYPDSKAAGYLRAAGKILEISRQKRWIKIIKEELKSRYIIDV